MPHCDLVLEGGGVRGVALVGAVEVLAEAGYTFARVAGSSAGAIVAGMLAADIPAPKVSDVVRALSYRNIADAPRFVRRMGPLGWLGKAFLLLRDGGMYEGRYFSQWMAEQLHDSGVRTFGDLRIDDPGSSLPAHRQYRLVVTASDVTASRLRRLPWDYTALGYEPDSMSVVDAIRASMSIPFFFRPVHVPHPHESVPTTLVDGGVLSNYPITIFDRTDGRPPRWPTFGIKLTAHDEQRTAVRGFLGTRRAIFRTVLEAHDAQHLDDPAVRARTIRVDAGWVDSRHLRLSKNEADALYEAGRNAATAFLRTWDWEDYQRRYGRRPASLGSSSEAQSD